MPLYLLCTVIYFSLQTILLGALTATIAQLNMQKEVNAVEIEVLVNFLQSSSDDTLLQANKPITPQTLQDKEAGQTLTNATTESKIPCNFNHHFFEMRSKLQRLLATNMKLSAENEDLKQQRMLDVNQATHLLKKVEELTSQLVQQKQAHQKLKDISRLRQDNLNRLKDLIEKQKGEELLLVTRISLLEKNLKDNEDSLKQYQNYGQNVEDLLKETESMLVTAENSMAEVEQKNRKLMDKIRDLEGEYQLVRSQNLLLNSLIGNSDYMSQKSSYYTCENNEPTTILKKEDLDPERSSDELEWDSYDFLDTFYGFGNQSHELSERMQDFAGFEDSIKNEAGPIQDLEVCKIFSLRFMMLILNVF